jgi:peptide deformylase
MKIVHYPHPALRHPARMMTSIDKKLHLHVGQMWDVLYEAKGLGLAATQVALPYQLLLINITGDPKQKDREEVYINPVIVERKGVQDDEEGCLSFPGLFQKVRRAKTVKVQAYNIKGEPVEIVASDLTARAWQHEIDHLNGVLFIDKMGLVAKLSARGSVKNFEKEFRRAQQRGDIPPDAEIEKFLAMLEKEADQPSPKAEPGSERNGAEAKAPEQGPQGGAPESKEPGQDEQRIDDPTRGTDPKHGGF